MTLFVLDTDHLSLFEKAHPQVLKNVVLHAMDPIAISVITILEQLEGWQRSLHQAKHDSLRAQIYRRMALTIESLSGWPVLPYTESAMQRRKTLLRTRLNVGSNDLKIAAIALDYQAILITRNLRDFARVPGLVLADWTI